MDTPLIKGEGLQRAFGGIHAVDNVDVSIGSHDLLCVIGPNGAGKSTLVGLLSGAIAPGAGELYLAGERMTGGRCIDSADAAWFASSKVRTHFFQ